MRLRLPPVRLWVTTLSVGFLLGGPEQADLMPYPLQCSPPPPSCPERGAQGAGGHPVRARPGTRGRGAATLGLPPPHPVPGRTQRAHFGDGQDGKGDCGRKVRGPLPSLLASAGQRARRGADLGLLFPRAARNPPGLAPTSPPRPDVCIALVLRGHSSSLTSGEVKAQSGTGLLGSRGQVGQRGNATAALPPGLGVPRRLHGDREALGTSPWDRGPRLPQALLAGVGGNSAVGRCRLLTCSAVLHQGYTTGG